MVYGYPYNNGYGYGTGLAALATAPLMTGRSVAASGDYCATPVKTCLLYHSSWVGNGCSCKVYDGYARGTVESEFSDCDGAEAWQDCGRIRFRSQYRLPRSVIIAATDSANDAD